MQLPTWLLPSVMLALSIAAAAAYALAGDWRRAVYWSAAAAITAVVTF